MYGDHTLYGQNLDGSYGNNVQHKYNDIDNNSSIHHYSSYGNDTYDGEKQLSQVPSTQGTSEVEWCDDGNIKGILKQRGEENITDGFEVKSNVGTSTFIKETYAEEMDNDVTIVGLS